MRERKGGWEGKAGEKEKEVERRRREKRRTPCLGRFVVSPP